MFFIVSVVGYFVVCEWLAVCYCCLICCLCVFGLDLLVLVLFVFVDAADLLVLYVVCCLPFCFSFV